MAKETAGGWIKLSRKILEWRWYHDVNTKMLFIHLLLKANIKDHDFERDTIHRGELATSLGSLAAETGLTTSQIRTALSHLKDTNEIAITRHAKYLVISIKNYSQYQGDSTEIARKSQSDSNHFAITSQQSKNKKNDKEGEEYARVRATPEYLPREEQWVIGYDPNNDDDDDDQ